MTATPFDGSTGPKIGLFVDATLGGGGYSEAILAASNAALVFGFDTDPAAQRFATERLAPFGNRCRENGSKIWFRSAGRPSASTPTCAPSVPAKLPAFSALVNTCRVVTWSCRWRLPS